MRFGSIACATTTRSTHTTNSTPHANLNFSPCSRAFIPANQPLLDLQIDLHRELNLPRGSRLAGGKPCTRDLAKGGSSDHDAGWAKVCVIKKIEELGAKLHPKFFAES